MWDIVWNDTKLDVTDKKLMDSSKIHQQGWKHQIDLVRVIEKTYD